MKYILIILTALLLFSCSRETPLSVENSSMTLSIQNGVHNSSNGKAVDWPDNFTAQLTISGNGLTTKTFELNITKQIVNLDSVVYRAVEPVEVPPGRVFGFKFSAMIDSVNWEFQQESVVISATGNTVVPVVATPAANDLLTIGWRDFTAARYTESMNRFKTLIDLSKELAKANCGMGWCLAYTQKPDSAQIVFLSGLKKQPDPVTKNDLSAGLAVVYDALGLYQNCLTYTDSVQTNWTFRYKTGVNYNDMIVLRAVSYYALADFAGSLLEVKKLDAAFNCDVNTAVGRAELAAKIEALRNAKGRIL